MKAMVLERCCSLLEEDHPLRLADVAEPACGNDDLLIQVFACGVCHTELDEIEGRMPPAQLPMILGHEVVGRVIERGAGATHVDTGTRVGVGWVHHSTGEHDENLSPDFIATGRDVNGGYAQYMTVPAAYAHPIPDAFDDYTAAPLLCAGAIGYRALRLTGIGNGGALGLTGFGGSAHLTLQLARHLLPQTEIFVFARSPQTCEFARSQGAAWAGSTDEMPPRPLDAIIDTTPVWRPVIAALGALKPGGRLVINAIRKQEDDKRELLELSYHEHLWMEREIKSVANITRFDIREFLEVAAQVPLAPKIEVYPLAHANRALTDLKRGTVRGAKVLAIEPP
jgi:propanol-preferring alcohol dehydrogenase